MKYAEVLNKAMLAGAIKMADGEKRLNKSAAVDVAILRAELERGRHEFFTKMQDIEKGLKPEGYDDRLSDYQRMQDITRRKQAASEWDGTGEAPKQPTADELAEAEELAKKLEGFENEMATLNEQLQEAHDRLADEESSLKKVTLSRETLGHIYEVMDLEADSGLRQGGRPMNELDLFMALTTAFVA